MPSFHLLRRLLLAVTFATLALGARAVSDFQISINTFSSISYRMVSVSSPKFYAGPGGTNNPTLSLMLGKRYAVDNTAGLAHPFEVIASGLGDVVLLSQSAAGSLEGDAGINWVEAGSVVEFTVTPSLLSAMRQDGRTPGYRCAIHTSIMRGAFTIYGDGTPIADPIGPRITSGTITVELQPVISGLVSPLGATQPDDASGRLFVWDQIGKVWIVQSNGTSVTTPLLDVSARLVVLNGAYDERGLLGFATHPNFSTTPKVYTYTSEPVSGAAHFTVSNPSAFDHQSVIAEWTMSTTDTNQVNPATRRELLRIDQPQFNHNGGALQFGPDGNLYIALGDGGNADDEGDGHVADGNAQNGTLAYGKILRINPDTIGPNGRYTIPADNPFVGNGGVEEAWALGLRNPYTMSFDIGSSGTLYVGDAGQNKVEEVDLITRGANYGWRLREGAFYFDSNGAGAGFVTTTPVEPILTTLVDPIAQYDHDDGSVVVGGYVYRGGAIPALTGRFVLGDFGTSFGVPSGRLFYLDGTTTVREFILGASDTPFPLWLKGFGQDRAGEVYVCGSARLGPADTTGQVLKLVPPVVPNAVRQGAWEAYR